MLEDQPLDVSKLPEGVTIERDFVDVSVRVEQATGQARVSVGNSGFVQSSAGMIVQFAIFGLISSAMILPWARKNRRRGSG